MALQKVEFHLFFLNLLNVTTGALELSTTTMCVHIIAHTLAHINIYTGLHLLFLICYAQWEEEEGKNICRWPREANHLLKKRH